MTDPLAKGINYCTPDITPSKRVEESDARDLPFDDDSINLVVTSPPYWQKRDYGVEGQLGLESTVEEYVESLSKVLDELARVLHPTGSVFLNIGDTYSNGELVGVPAVFSQFVRENTDWCIRNDIIWAKDGGVPDPSPNRLAQRHEHVFHLVRNDNYYYDLHGWKHAEDETWQGEEDVWKIGFDRNTDGHLAPYPEELVRRALVLAAPLAVCEKCRTPYTRVTRKAYKLDESRPQAKRAMELYSQSELTEEHIEAIWAVGIADAGKAREIQDGTGRNKEQVQKLAEEAKEVLGGYFREFTFPIQETDGWEKSCDCSSDQTIPGTVLDPFVGTGTTVEVSLQNGLSAYGTDLNIPTIETKPTENYQNTLDSY